MHYEMTFSSHGFDYNDAKTKISCEIESGSKHNLVNMWAQGYHINYN